MAAIFQLPRTTPLDTNGLVMSGATLNFYDAGTSTPQAVYSDDGLSTEITQPIEADSAGRFQKIYLSPGTYKVILKDPDGNIIYTEDDCDTGVPAGTGALAVASGGTGATTAAGARTNLAAASQTDLDALSSDVGDIQDAITAVGGTLGDLAGLDEITQGELATGFGIIVLQRSEVASKTAFQSCTTAIPADNTIPTNSEGDQVMSGSFTPISASSKLRIEVGIMVRSETDTAIIGATLFTDASSAAIAAASMEVDDNPGAAFLKFEHWMDSPGTSAITISVRAGANTGNVYINALNSTTRLYGGVLKSYIRVTEYLSF